jgi:hypothetical protein
VRPRAESLPGLALRAGIVLLTVLICGLLIVAAFKWVPDRLATKGLKPVDHAQDLARIRTASLAALAGLIAVVGAIFTGLSYRLNRAGHITERFTRAIDQLGNAELDIRLGGIYALERVARDSKDDHPQVVEVLTAYVREHAPWPPRSRSATIGQPGSETLAGLLEAIRALERIARGADTPTTETPGEQTGSEQDEIPQLPTDVQAAMSVLGRRNSSLDRPGARLNLEGTDLRRAGLPKANLHNAILDYSNLESAILKRSNLQEASLVKANLYDAILFRANLQGTNLNGANLEAADLVKANLQGALVGANLRSAHLAGANLHAADLQMAKLQDTRYDDCTQWPNGFDPEAAGALPLGGDADHGSVPAGD